MHYEIEIEGEMYTLTEYQEGAAVIGHDEFVVVRDNTKLTISRSASVVGNYRKRGGQWVKA